MKKNILKHGLPIAIGILSSVDTIGQCGIVKNLGSATNMYSVVRNGPNPVAIDNNINSVIFLHRHNTNSFGGNSGNYRYDISTNGGISWTNDIGVLNPNSPTHGRYPNATIYNPPGNTNPSSAWLGYLGSTTFNGFWTDLLTGARQLNGAGNTEIYDQPQASSYLIAGSLVKGAPGVFWAIDATSNGVDNTGGINVFKGTWAGSNINWTTNHTFYPSYNLSYLGVPMAYDWLIAFDPGGNNGWICLSTHLNSGPNYYGYHPVFYKTTNGGQTWSGPITVNLSQLACISSNMPQGAFPSIAGAVDLAVDNNGNPHLLARVGVNDNNYSLNYNLWNRMFDLTQNNGVWTALEVGNPVSAVTSFTDMIGGGSAAHGNCPQVARSEDGTKIFFSWTDTPGLQGGPNTNPDLYARGYDVVQNKWTQIKNFTSCSINAAGKIWYPHVAERVFEPGGGVYKIAPVYAEFSNLYDVGSVAYFRYLDNCNFNSTEFTIAQSTVNLNVQPTGTLVMCQGTNINLSISGSFSSVYWSNGTTNMVNTVTSPGIYSVVATSGCAIGTASVQVDALTMSVVPTTNSICAGSSLQLNLSGNASGYTVTPGNLSGTSFTLSPVASTTYTVSGSGYLNCTSSTMIPVTVNPVPQVFALTTDNQICPGEETVLIASGAGSFLWSTGATDASITINPFVTTTYTVTGTTSGCSASSTVTQIVDLCAGIAANEKENNSLVAFPNPAENMLTVVSHSGGTAKLFNNLGQTVMQFELKSDEAYQADLSDLAPGIYFLNLENGSSPSVKILVQR